MTRAMIERKPRIAHRFKAPVSRDGQCAKIMVDVDNAGDLNTRRSTVRHVAFLTSHVVKHACNFLPGIGLLSAEHEYYAISVGSCTGVGPQSLLRDWDVNRTLRDASDSPASKRFTSKLPFGDQKKTERADTCGRKND